MKRLSFIAALLFYSITTNSLYAQGSRVVESKTTQLTVTIPSEEIAIDPMIYGQMLEDCNDKVIYGGIVSNEGEERYGCRNRTIQ